MIKFYTLLGYSFSEIWVDLHAVYIEWCYFKVVNRFKDGRETTNDDKYTG